MQCPKCGYVLGEFETDCLRCKRAGNGTIPVTRLQVAPVLTAQAATPAMREPAADEKECPRCGKAADAGVAACDKCGYEYRPGESQAERYQALLAEEARTPAPTPALRRTVSPYVSWGLIGVCLLAVLGASYSMLAPPLAGRSAFQESMDSPVISLHRHKPRHAGALRAVAYKVTGTASQAIVTYRGEDGALVSLPVPVSLPWTEALKLKPGSDLSLSVRPAAADGTVVAEIDVDDVARKQSNTAGTDGATSVSDTL